jgi:hypothetical protein
MKIILAQSPSTEKHGAAFPSFCYLVLKDIPLSYQVHVYYHNENKPHGEKIFQNIDNKVVYEA